LKRFHGQSHNSVRVVISVAAKTPGPDLKCGTVTMDFRYGEVFGGQSPEAYERLLLDAMHGDPTLYARGDWVELAWQILDPVLKAWRGGTPALYEAGTWGPADAEPFIVRDGGAWHQP